MAKSKTLQIRPSIPFTAKYSLTISDAVMVQIDSAYLYIFSTATTLLHYEIDQLTQLLTQSLASFFQQPERSPYNLPELLGKVYEDPATGQLTVEVLPSSYVPFTICDRVSDIHINNLSLNGSFPLQPLRPSIFGVGITAPPPDATKGLQALWIQLTLIEQGFVVHFHVHHWIVGAMSSGRFVEAWFERARLIASAVNSNDTATWKMNDILFKSTILFGGREELANSLRSVKVTQLEHPDFLHVPGGRRVWAGLDLHPMVLLVLINIFMFVVTYLPFLLPRTDVQIFHFTADSLKELRSALQNEVANDMREEVNQLTANDCLAALLWSRITHARFGSIKTALTAEHDRQLNAPTSTILIAVDYRSRIDPPLNPNYFGNSNLDIYTELPISSLISAHNNSHNLDSKSEQTKSFHSLSKTAQSIHNSIISTTNHQIRSIYQLIASRPRIPDTRKKPITFQFGPDLLYTSWEHVHTSPELLQLDILPSTTNSDQERNRITFEKMRCMGGDGLDGAVVVFPAYGRKWIDQKEKDLEVDSGNSGDREGNASHQTGLEVMISLRRDHMELLMKDDIFTKYASWDEIDRNRRNHYEP